MGDRLPSPTHRGPMEIEPVCRRQPGTCGRRTPPSADGSRPEQRGRGPAARLPAVKSRGAPTPQNRLAALEVALAETAYPEAIEGSEPLIQRQGSRATSSVAGRLSALTPPGVSTPCDTPVRKRRGRKTSHLPSAT